MKFSSVLLALTVLAWVAPCANQNGDLCAAARPGGPATQPQSFAPRDTADHVYRLSSGSAASGVREKGAPLEIRWIGNEGFLIARGDKKVLIDAPQTNPRTGMPTGERVFSMMLENRPPFDGIDLCVASHAHGDHFNARMMVELLRRNAHLVFISSPIACDSLRMAAGAGFGEIAKRVVSVDPEWKTLARLRRNGVDVAFLGVNHAGPGETPYKTLATVIDFGGIRVAHLADEVAASNVENYKAVQLENEGIDIVFLDSGFFDSNGEEILNEYIRPDYLILMHARPNEVDEEARPFLAAHRNLILFHEQLERKLFR